jgi:hypothetical protein
MANPLAPVKGLRGFWPNGILPQGRMLGLVVVVGCFLGVLAVITLGNPPSATAPAPRQDLPEEEKKFCEITSTASRKYFDFAREARKAREDKNGIVEKKHYEAMTKTVRERNESVLELARQTNFIFENWRVQLLEIGRPGDKNVSFSVRPLCSNIVTIHLDAPVSGAFFRTLATKAKGSSLLVSGRFVASRFDSAANPLPQDPGTFEQSATEDGSMREPEYKGLLRE